MNTPHITMASGAQIPGPADFDWSMVDIQDIIVGLPNLCRYNGQLTGFYSVAEHSVLVARMAFLAGDYEAELPALLHDAHEIYSGDLPFPQKAMIEGFTAFEDVYQNETRRALGLPGEEDPVWGRVAYYDKMIPHREVATMRAPLPDWYDPLADALVDPEIMPLNLSPQEARELFSRTLSFLTQYETNR